MCIVFSQGMQEEAEVHINNHQQVSLFEHIWQTVNILLKNTDLGIDLKHLSLQVRVHLLLLSISNNAGAVSTGIKHVIPHLGLCAAETTPTVVHHLGGCHSLRL